MMRDTLRRQLADPATAARLRALAGDAAAATPVSLHLDLGAAGDDWLACLPKAAPWWYWARPARGEFQLGIGQAFQVESAGPNRFAALDHAWSGLCRDWRRTGAAQAFAGFAFDPQADNRLPNALLAVPALLLQHVDGRSSAILTTPAGRLASAAEEWLALLSQPAAPAPLPALRPARPDMLAAQAWEARVGAALRDIGHGRLDKVVLARSRVVTAEAPLPPAAVLRRLLAQQPDATIYGHGHGTVAFVGATPERLVRLQEGQIAVDALAGTAWPGSLELADDKNRREQALVTRAICDALREHGRAAPQVGGTEEHAAGSLRHWRSRIAVAARPGTRLFDLVRALHPTPAVGGFPTQAALDWLAAHGERRPGWYSGAIGRLVPDGDGEFCVALRCALIDGLQAELLAGAGIVAGSIPADELAETEAKLGTLLAALHTDADDCRRTG